MEPLERSAITEAAQASASRMASSMVSPSSRFSRYLARTRDPAVNSSIQLMGALRTADTRSVLLLTSGSDPLRLVRKSDRSTKPSASFMFRSASHMPLSRFRLFMSAPPWASGIKFVSQEPGFRATILAATRPSRALARL